MSKLIIETDMNELYICGSFCNWDLKQSIHLKKRKLKTGIQSTLSCNIPDYCEYKILSSNKGWEFEEQPKRNNRVKNEVINETIKVNF